MRACVSDEKVGLMCRFNRVVKLRVVKCFKRAVEM